MTTPITAARGVAKIVTVAVESSFGTAGTGPGQSLRRVSSDLNLNITPINSQEILPSQQVRDMRLGPRQVAGTLTGQLSPGTYQRLFENMIRNTFTLGGTTGAALSDTTLTVAGTPSIGTLVSTAGNFNTLGFKHGDIIRFTDTPTVDAAENIRVIGIPANNTLSLATFPGSMTAWSGTETSLAIATPGKKLFVPATGQTFGSLTFEHWYSDISISELFLGCKVTQMSINIPASGFVTMQASLIGQTMTTSGTQNYAAPTAPSTTTSLTAVGGTLYYKDTAIAVVTSASIQISSTAEAPPVVGSNIIPAVFLGTLSVRGSITALTIADTMTADFLGEVELTLSFYLTTGPTVNADFVHIFLPRVKLMTSTKTDSDRSISRSYQFMALENDGNNATITDADYTTIMIQDSLAV